MKISRTAIVFAMLLAGSAQASSWSDLWYRRDQQAQHALQAGDSKRAAELFADPRRQAYAELQSQQYAAAAKRLEPFADAESQYNRGNALAKSGDLQGALGAYDGALEHADLESALRRDAEHNRDLVARQLQAQKDQQQSSSGRQPPPKGKEDGKPQGRESKDGSGDSGSSSPPATAGSASNSQGETSEPKAEPSGSTPSQAPPPSQHSSPSSPAHPEAGDEQGQTHGTPQSTKNRDASSPQPSGQQAAGQQANGGRQETSPESGARTVTEELNSRKAAIGDPSLPQTERQIALEQWLRQIPDDPGGLLRRKFMIEHLMKQQQVQP
jgi:Ca-activated chloride channel family protein